MIGHRDTAGRAGNCLAAASARYEAVISSSVDEEDRLLIPLLVLHKALAKRVSKRRRERSGGILSHIYYRNTWKLCVSVSAF